jgi:hypothetical protein
VTELLDRIRTSLVGLRIPRALEALDHTVRRLERGELSAIEAIDGLLAEEHSNRESRRVAVALKTARLHPPKCQRMARPICKRVEHSAFQSASTYPASELAPCQDGDTRDALLVIGAASFGR